MINLKDVLVVALALAGGLSDFNNFDIPFWVYIVLLVIYAALRLFDKSIDVLSVSKDDGLSRPTKSSLSRKGDGLSRPTKGD